MRRPLTDAAKAAASKAAEAGVARAIDEGHHALGGFAYGRADALAALALHGRRDAVAEAFAIDAAHDANSRAFSGLSGRPRGRPLRPSGRRA